MNRPKAQSFPREVSDTVVKGQPVYTGHATVVQFADGIEILVMASSKRGVSLAAQALAPGIQLDPAAIYPVGIIHRSNIRVESDKEEL